MSVKRLHQVEAELVDNRVVQTELTVERLPSRDWTLIAAVPGLSDIVVTGGDLFECLRAVKLTTDAAGIRLLCNGARRDVWPSGMIRDMTGASKVYITTMGRPTTPSDLVPIFGLTTPELVGTVQEQNRYHEDWLRSLTNALGERKG